MTLHKYSTSSDFENVELAGKLILSKNVLVGSINTNYKYCDA